MNHFKEITLDKEVFFINQNKDLFKNDQQRIEYYGYLDPITNKCIRNHKHRKQFHHEKDLFTKKENNKPHIIYFLEKSVLTYQTMLFCEYLSKKYTVFVVGDINFDIVINDVIFIKTCPDVVNELYTKTFDNVFIEGFTFFLHFNISKLKTKNITYVHHKLKINHDILFLDKNYIHKINKFIFYSKDELLYFYLYHDLEKYTNKDKFEIKDYIYPQNVCFINNNNKNEKIKIVSYDKHELDAVDFLKGISNKNDKYELVLFTNQLFANNNNNNNITYLPRNEKNLIDNLKDADVFFTGESRKYTHFNISLALKFNIKCIVPKYYNFLKDKCICFDNINDAIKKYLE